MVTSAPRPGDRTMRLVVVTTPRLGAGFRLAGATVVEAEDANGADEALRALVAEGERGVVAVHAPFFDGLPAAVRGRFEASIRPVVIPIPEGLEGTRPEDRRARFAELLQRAVGYHLVFGGEEEEHA